MRAGKPKKVRKLAWGKSDTRSKVPKGPWISDEHRRWVKSQPCLSCHRLGADPHHCRKLGPEGTKGPRDDALCVPLCRTCHDKAHEGLGGEREFWHRLGSPHIPFICRSPEGRATIARLIIARMSPKDQEAFK
jgi:hypothetical protein